MSTQDKGHHLQAQEKGLQQIPPLLARRKNLSSWYLDLEFPASRIGKGLTICCLSQQVHRAFFWHSKLAYLR